jgi:hypothetical protein
MWAHGRLDSAAFTGISQTGIILSISFLPEHLLGPIWISGRHPLHARRRLPAVLALDHDLAQLRSFTRSITTLPSYSIPHESHPYHPAYEARIQLFVGAPRHRYPGYQIYIPYVSTNFWNKKRKNYRFVRDTDGTPDGYGNKTTVVPIKRKFLLQD